MNPDVSLPLLRPRRTFGSLCLSITFNFYWFFSSQMYILKHFLWSINDSNVGEEILSDMVKYCGLVQWYFTSPFVPGVGNGVKIKTLHLVIGQTTLAKKPLAPEEYKGKAQVTGRESAALYKCNEIRVCIFHLCYVPTATVSSLSIMGAVIQ